MGGIKGDGVELTVGEVPSVGRGRALVVAAAHQHGSEEDKETLNLHAHKHSWCNGYSRRTDENDVHRGRLRKVVRAKLLFSLPYARKIPGQSADNGGTA